MKKKINTKKIIKRILISFLIIGTVVFYLANKKLKSYGYDGVIDLLSTYKENVNLSKGASPTIVQLNLSDSDYDFIKERRKVALDRGLQINDGNNYVDCSVLVGADSVSGVMRLKGHMTDHLEGEKWSFRVKTENEIMGMYRFSLQHPGTRNYIYEWIYHQLLKNEDVIYLKYDFVNLKLNDKNLGIYAVEEHFGQHILDRNNRPKGALIRWNPSLYWEWRIDEFQGVYLDEEYSSFSSSFAEPYDKGVVLKDKELLANYEKAITNLEQFRRGEKKTSEVFDVERMAKFHAIIDLVGGHHSLDWSDVKFYFNSKTQKLEPVGYESFSIRKTESIAGQRILESYDELQFNYHAQLFSDPIFYAEYIKQLERIANESYLKEFKDKIQEELNLKLGIIALEWPHRKFNFDGYFENIRLIRNNLDLPKPVHAFIQSHNSDSIVLSLAPVSDFPIEILGLKKKKKEYSIEEPYVLSPKARHSVIKYFGLTFYGKFEKIKNLILLARIPGSSKIFEVQLEKYPSYKSDFENELIFIEEDNVKLDTNLVSINGDKIIVFKNKKTIIDDKMVVPKGYNLVLYPGQIIELNNKLVINGTLNSHGFKDDCVKIESKALGSLIINGIFDATNTEFSGSNSILSNNAKLNFYHCLFYDIEGYLIKDFQSNIVFNHCSGGNINMLCYLNESNSYFKDCFFNKGELLVKSNAALVRVSNCELENYTKICDLDNSSQFYIWSSTIAESDTLFNLSNTSSFQSYSSVLTDFNVGFVLHKNEFELKGEPSYQLYKTDVSEFNQLAIKI